MVKYQLWIHVVRLNPAATLLLWFAAQITSYLNHKLYYCSLGFIGLYEYSELPDMLIYKAIKPDIYSGCVSVSTCVMLNMSSGSARRQRVGSAILFYRGSSARLKIEEIRTMSLEASVLLHTITKKKLWSDMCFM